MKVANALTVSILENRTATNSVIPLTLFTQSSQVGKWAHSVRWPSCGLISQITFTKIQFADFYTVKVLKSNTHEMCIVSYQHVEQQRLSHHFYVFFAWHWPCRWNENLWQTHVSFLPSTHATCGNLKNTSATISETSLFYHLRNALLFETWYLTLGILI